jgi:hypothetical protein
MGAQDFTQTICIRGDVHKAIAKARDEARDENGHQQGYSGDIQTCDDVTILHCEFPQFETKKFIEWRDDRLDNMSKWHAEIIEVVSNSAVKRVKNNHGYKGKRNVRVFHIWGIGGC